MPPRQREHGSSAGFRAAVPSAVMTLRAGERFRSEKLVGTEKAVIFAPRTSERCPARQGGRQRGASGDGRRSATTGQQSAAVGSGIMQQTAGGCFGTQTAPPTCSDGGSNGRRKQTGCSAVRLAHLLWEQGVAGSNPVSPTIDNQPLAATQVVFYWGRRHTIYTQNRRFSGCVKADTPAKAGFSDCVKADTPAKAGFPDCVKADTPAKAGFPGCIKAGSPQKPISARLRIARLRGLNHVKEPPPHASGKQTPRSTIDPGAPTAAEPSRPEPPPIRVTTNPGDPPRALRSPEPRRRRSLSRPEARQTRRAPSATPEASRSHLPCPPVGQSRRVRMRHRTPRGVCTVSTSPAR